MCVFYSHIQILELQAVNVELQKKLVLMEKGIVGHNPKDSQTEPDLINLLTPVKVLSHNSIRAKIFTQLYNCVKIQ